MRFLTRPAAKQALAGVMGPPPPLDSLGAFLRRPALRRGDLGETLATDSLALSKPPIETQKLGERDQRIDLRQTAARSSCANANKIGGNLADRPASDIVRLRAVF